MDRQLLDALPPALRPVREYQAIMASEQMECEALYRAQQDTLNNLFPQTAGDYGLGRWERMLNITPRGTDTLDDRRFRVLSRLSEQIPYTITALRQQLSMLCGPDGYTAQVDPPACLLTVRVALTAKKAFADVGALLRRVAPANLVIDLSLLYNQHQTLAAMTYAQLAAYTHQQLREDAI